MCVGRYGISGKFVGINYALLPNREWNKKQKHKKRPWSNVECFAFGGATVRFASLETSFHAANHTIPPPPSYESSPHCTKDKNRSPFHGEKPLVIKRILGRRSYQISQTILHGRDAILRPRQIIDIQYDTTIMGGREVSRRYLVWFFAEVEWFLSFCRSTNARCEALVSLKGCFLCFCFCATSIYPLNRKMRKGIS